MRLRFKTSRGAVTAKTRETNTRKAVEDIRSYSLDQAGMLRVDAGRKTPAVAGTGGTLARPSRCAYKRGGERASWGCMVKKEREIEL